MRDAGHYSHNNRHSNRHNRPRVLIDVGGQSCRAVAIEGDGHMLAHASRSAPARTGLDGPDALVHAVNSVLAEVVSGQGSKQAHLASAGLAVERGSVLCWDRISGQALTPVLSWQDRRGSNLVSMDAGTRERVKTRTGLRLTPYGGASKLKWCLEEVAAVARALKQDRLAWGPLGSFLAFRLLEGQPFLVDDSLAQRTLLWSHHSLDWDDELLDLFGLPAGCLPAVVPSQHRFGRLSAIDSHPPLDLMIGDQNAVPFASRAADPDTFYINLGTGAFLLRPVHEPVKADVFQLSLLSRKKGGRYALEATVHGAATAINWLADQSGREIGSKQLNDIQARSAPPLFINTVGGLGSPWWTPGPAASFTGGTSSLPDFDDQLTAVLESIAFLIRTNFDKINQLVGPPRRILITGGLSGSTHLCQLIADALQQETCRSHNPEATIMGMWQQLGAGSRDRQVLTTFQPQPAARLAERYQHWLAAMPPLTGAD